MVSPTSPRSSAEGTALQGSGAHASGIEIRRVRPDEYASVGRMVRAAYETAYRLDGGYLAEIEDVAGRDVGAEVLVAEQAGRILGSVTIPRPGERQLSDSREDELDVRLLGVAPEARGLGVGAILMSHCARVARERGLRSVVLHTGEQMLAAQRLYERLGFVRVPEREFGITVSDGTRRIFAYRLDLAGGPGEDADSGQDAEAAPRPAEVA